MKKMSANSTFKAYCDLCNDLTWHRITSNSGELEDTQIVCEIHEVGEPGKGCYILNEDGTCQLGLWKISRRFTSEELKEIK